MIDFRKLRHIVTLADDRSFTRAAARLRITQPALSRSIADLETECGQQLFDRTAEGAEPTAFARPLLEKARRMLADADQFDREIMARATAERGKAAFGAGPLVAALAYGRLLSQFARERPALEVEATTGSAEKLIADLRSGRIEFAVIAESIQRMSGDLVTKRVGTILPAILARRDHPLMTRQALAIPDLAQYPLVSGLGLTTDTGFHREGGIIRSDDFLMLRQIVIETDAVWLASAELAAKDPELAVLDMDWPYTEPLPLLQIALEGRTMSPPSREAAQRLTALLTS